MRVLIDLVPLLLVAGLGLAAWRSVVRNLAGRGQLVAGARWRAGHLSDGRRTHVVVQLVAPGGARVLESREVGVVPDDAPDYDLLFMDAMATARSRAITLNAESIED